MTEIKLPCTEGNATLKAFSLGTQEHPKILTGKRRKFDSLYWSLWNDTGKGHEINLQGLYRGRCCDAKVMAKDLHKALLLLGMTETAQKLSNACKANGEVL